MYLLYNTSVFSVILARPENSENIGLVARAMKNTGFKDLRLAGIKNLKDKAFKTAVHAEDILKDARRYPDLDAAHGESEDEFSIPDVRGRAG
jgi:tRNA/rRNA methyltransferase